jgi:predicted RNA-binding protein
MGLNIFNINNMKYIFRGIVVFEYNPEAKFDKVIEGQIHGLHAFNYCGMIPEDYKLLGEFFDKVYRHTQGEDVLLEDIEVN